MPLSTLKFHFLQITFFSAVITRTHHLPTHTPFFRPIMSKKRALHLFLKITFFCSVLLLITPEDFLIIFSGKLKTKNSQKTSQRRKIFFSFFFIIYFTFSLSPYGKKQNHLLFPPFLSPEIGKRERKMSFKKKNVFFFFFDFFPPYRFS